MADAICSPNQQCIVVHTVKDPADWIEVGHGVESWLTAAGLIVAAWWAYRSDWIKTRADARAERDLREQERHQNQNQLLEQQQNREWEQTTIAREINEQFINDPYAKVATDLVDWDGEMFKAREKDQSGDPCEYDFSKQEDVKALRIFGDHEAPKKQEEYLRTCFDVWFYWMAAMEQYLENGLIRQKDMAFPSDYYLRYLRKDEDLYAACIRYVTHYKLSSKVLEFMKRFEEADGVAAGAAAIGAESDSSRKLGSELVGSYWLSLLMCAGDYGGGCFCLVRSRAHTMRRFEDTFAYGVFAPFDSDDA